MKLQCKQAVTTLGLTLIALVSLWQPSFASCQVESYSNQLIEISRNRKDRAGSGVIVTSDGYILTARHVIHDPSTPPRDRPLNVYVRHNGGDWKNAQITAAHSYLDVALLKVAASPGTYQVNKLYMAEPIAGESTNYCITGFPNLVQYSNVDGIRSATIVQESIQSLSTVFDRKKFGYLLFDKGSESSYSGGGAFREDFLTGIIAKTSTTHTFVIGLDRLAQFLSFNGLVVDENGFLQSGLRFSDFANKVSVNTKNINKNRKQIARIMSAVNWTFQLEKDTITNKLVKLHAINERNLPIQNILITLLVRIYPIFLQKSSEILSLNRKKRKYITKYYENIVLGDGIIIEITDQDIDVAILEYEEDGLLITTPDIHALEIDYTVIDSIFGEKIRHTPHMIGLEQ